MFTLFSMPGTCSRASHIALEESGLPYKVVRVDFSKQEQKSGDFLAINPKGRVPALSTSSGILTETPAILVFIAQMAPSAKLAPLDDVFEFARMQSFNAYVSSTVHVAHAHGPRGNRWADEPASLEDMKRKAPQVLADCFEIIEQGFQAGPWVLGNQYSISDPYLFIMSGWLERHGIDIARFPRVHEHYDRVSKREAVLRVIEAEKQL